MTEDIAWTRRLEELSSDDVAQVGGKNASLGEMIRTLGAQGVRVPRGFATTARAYRELLADGGLEEAIRGLLDDYHTDRSSLEETGEAIRELGEREGLETPHVAVRSSATAEDLPDASFAGQQDSFLNVAGEEDLLEACKRCYASLFTDRAIAYREEKGFDHLEVALSAGVQRMVRSDLGSAGVLFTVDTETGFPETVVINAAWGLGESVVQGAVTPDQYTVFKPFLRDADGEGGDGGPRRVPVLDPILDRELGAKREKTVYADGSNGAGDTIETVETSDEERRSRVLDDEEILRLARWGVAIEDHYGRPMDVEWAKDGRTGELFIVQARPETVQSHKDVGRIRTYTLEEKSEILLSGLAIGSAVAAGKVQVIERADEIDRFEEGSVLVTSMTDPDWVPVMKQAAGIVTDRGGRTSHAAIVSRELGIPAVVGTGRATEVLEDGREVTLSCVEGHEGRVYDGILEYSSQTLDLSDVPEVETRILMNIASPAGAIRWWRLPCHGIGLARMEYIVNEVIQVHPMALLHPDRVPDEDRERIEELTAGYDDPAEYFVDHLARGIATIAAARHPDPVIVRTSDFKTNEYADLVGGRVFEPEEENPMLGWRGASRYYSEGYREGFALECRALRRVREHMGFTNVVVMIPFCRTPEEADRVLEVMADEGLVRGKDGLKVYVMAEVPSNIVEAEAFARRFDGFSIGSNDLTQLVLGVGRDSEELADLFDERETSVRWMIRHLIETAHEAGRPVGICGQAPSDHPELAEFLVECGIDSISLNPDSVLRAIRHVADAEARHRTVHAASA
jgi:pyruvate,water dikinase